MFEFNQYQKRLHRNRIIRPQQPYDRDDNVARISLLCWGEHCTECAAPSCYKTCDLYQARPDGRCRRFIFGMYRNRFFTSLRGYGCEVAFKKWAALVARGNIRMMRLTSAIWAERLLSAFGLIFDRLGALASRATSDMRWKHLSYSLMLRLTNALAATGSKSQVPDAFLLDVYNPAPKAARLQFTVETAPVPHNNLVELGRKRIRFSTTAILPPGYSSHEFDGFLFRNIVESGMPFDLSLTPEADSDATLVFLSADFIIHKNRPQRSDLQRPIKCVVFDLDNTLWDGTLAENDEPKLKPRVRALLNKLDSRGILLSIASKNDFDAAWSHLSALELQEYFLHPQINWYPKSHSLKLIAEKLSIGLDTFAFIDDSPFERSEVAMALPEVTRYDAKDMPEILDNPRFAGSKTSEAGQRRQYYLQAIARQEKQAAFGQDYTRFLAYCETTVKVIGYEPQDTERIEELVQRTNQLNFSGTKYTRTELADLLVHSGLEKYVLHCSDRFGDYGVVGFAIVQQRSDMLEVRDFMLSCRVQGKLVELAFFHHLQQHHNMSGAPYMRINFRRTDRNTPAFQVLQTLGASEQSEGQGIILNLQQTEQKVGIVRIECFCGSKDALTGLSQQHTTLALKNSPMTDKSDL
jgi:FkbH-like protein